MKHVLVSGMSESGKTSYVIALCWILKRLGWVIVWFTAIPDVRLDRLTKYVTYDRSQALAWFWSFKRCIFVFDEGSVTVKRHDAEMERTATQGRHLNKEKTGGQHCCIYICQSAQQISPTVRGMCSVVVAFLQEIRSCEILADLFVQPALLEASKLRKLEYIRYERFGVVEKGVVKP